MRYRQASDAAPTFLKFRLIKSQLSSEAGHGPCGAFQGAFEIAAVLVGGFRAGKMEGAVTRILDSLSKVACSPSNPALKLLNGIAKTMS